MATLDTQDDALDRLFDVLSHPARRRALVRCRTLAERDEAGLSPVELVTGDAPMNRQLAELYHQHLPKLAAAGYVEWEPTEGTVRPGPQFAEVEPVLALLDENQAALPATWP
jgi:hypothetical protein